MAKGSELQKGDWVEALDSEDRGRIVAVDGDAFLVLTEDGFEMPFHREELILWKRDIQVSPAEAARSQLQKEVTKKRHKPTRTKREKQQPPMEVDLHIEKLLPKHSHMDTYDILSYQLDTAEHRLKFAIGKRLPRVVFIHGVGEGVLKTELHYLLGRYPEVSFEDANYREYGQGATLVYIHQNQTKS